MAENYAMHTTNSFFYWMEYSFGVVPVVKKWITSSKWSFAMRTAKSCASGSPYSKFVDSSPVLIREK